MVKKNKLMRIDVVMAMQIKEFAKKNDISLIQASKELAKMNKISFTNKKISKEIRF